MHETTTRPTKTGLENEITDASPLVSEMNKNHALEQVKRETVTAELSYPNPPVKLAHAEEAAKWACIARENGASEDDIDAAEQDAHHFIAFFGDDGA